MRKTQYRGIRKLAVLAFIIMISIPCSAGAETPENKWSFSITPNLWVPSMSTDMKFDAPGGSSGGPTAEVDSESILEALHFAFLATAEARYGKWAIITDLNYLNLQTDNAAIKEIDFFNSGPNPVSSSLNLNTDIELQALIVGLGGSYELVREAPGTLEVLAGARYFGLEASLDWNLDRAINGPGPGQVFQRSGSISQSDYLIDGIVGVRGHVNLSERWTIPYYFDIGAGSSEYTWQGMLALSYEYKWANMILGYRHMYYKTDGKLINDATFTGPLLALKIRF